MQRNNKSEPIFKENKELHPTTVFWTAVGMLEEQGFECIHAVKDPNGVYSRMDLARLYKHKEDNRQIVLYQPGRDNSNSQQLPGNPSSLSSIIQDVNLSLDSNKNKLQEFDFEKATKLIPVCESNTYLGFNVRHYVLAVVHDGMLYTEDSLTRLLGAYDESKLKQELQALGPFGVKQHTSIRKGWQRNDWACGYYDIKAIEKWSSIHDESDINKIIEQKERPDIKKLITNGTFDTWHKKGKEIYTKENITSSSNKKNENEIIDTNNDILNFESTDFESMDESMEEKDISEKNENIEKEKPLHDGVKLAFSKLACPEEWEVDSHATPYHLFKREDGKLVMSMSYVTLQNKNDPTQKEILHWHSEVVFDNEGKIESLVQQPMQRRVKLPEQPKPFNPYPLSSFLNEWARAPGKEEYFGEIASASEFINTNYPKIAIEEGNIGQALYAKEDVNEKLKDYLSNKFQLTDKAIAQKLISFIPIGITEPFISTIQSFLLEKPYTNINLGEGTLKVLSPIKEEEGITYLQFEYSFDSLNYVDPELTDILSKNNIEHDSENRHIPFPCTISFTAKVENNQLIIDRHPYVSNPAIALILSGEVNNLSLEKILQLGQSGQIEPRSVPSQLLMQENSQRKISQDVTHDIMEEESSIDETIDTKKTKITFIKTDDNTDNRSTAYTITKNIDNAQKLLLDELKKPSKKTGHHYSMTPEKVTSRLTEMHLAINDPFGFPKEKNDQININLVKNNLMVFTTNNPHKPSRTGVARTLYAVAGGLLIGMGLLSLALPPMISLPLSIILIGSGLNCLAHAKAIGEMRHRGQRLHHFEKNIEESTQKNNIEEFQEKLPPRPKNSQG